VLPADLLDEVALKPGELPVVEGRVDGGDQVTALSEDAHERELSAGVVGHGFLPPVEERRSTPVECETRILGDLPGRTLIDTPDRPDVPTWHVPY